MSFWQLALAVFVGVMGKQLLVHAHNLYVVHRAKKARMAELRRMYATFGVDDSRWDDVTPGSTRVPPLRPPQGGLN